MGDTFIMPEGLQLPHKIYKADSGGIKFVMRANHIAYQWLICPTISLINKECPHKTIYEIKIDYITGYMFLQRDGIEKKKAIPDCISPNAPRKCWLSWYNDTIQIGLVKSSKCLNPFFQYRDRIAKKLDPKEIIGFIQFTVNKHIDWVVESSPVFLKPVNFKHVDDGELVWVKMTGDKLPSDALIGGFEHEPIYIARAMHESSICPGKYVPSKKEAYIPWGHLEHRKTKFEILCGFNGYWVKCKDNFVPENVFVAGTSEAHGEDIYIGRAMIGDDLIVGKVHMLYKTCYLPYKGNEVEKYTYEILVKGDKRARGVTINRDCSVNQTKAIRPCI